MKPKSLLQITHCRIWVHSHLEKERLYLTALLSLMALFTELMGRISRTVDGILTTI